MPNFSHEEGLLLIQHCIYKYDSEEMLKEKLNNWEKDKMKPLWTEGAMWDTITLMIHDDLMHNRKVRVKNPDDLEKFRLIH